MKVSQHTIGANITDIREAQGLSKVRLAKRIGIHRNLVAKVEMGQKQLSPKGLKVFAKALGVTVQDIIAGI